MNIDEALAFVDSGGMMHWQEKRDALAVLADEVRRLRLHCAPREWVAVAVKVPPEGQRVEFRTLAHGDTHGVRTGNQFVVGLPASWKPEVTHWRPI